MKFKIKILIFKRLNLKNFIIFDQLTFIFLDRKYENL